MESADHDDNDPRTGAAPKKHVLTPKLSKLAWNVSSKSCTDQTIRYPDKSPGDGIACCSNTPFEQTNVTIVENPGKELHARDLINNEENNVKRLKSQSTQGGRANKDECPRTKKELFAWVAAKTAPLPREQLLKIPTGRLSITYPALGIRVTFFGGEHMSLPIFARWSPTSCLQDVNGDLVWQTR